MNTYHLGRALVSCHAVRYQNVDSPVNDLLLYQKIEQHASLRAAIHRKPLFSNSTSILAGASMSREARKVKSWVYTPISMLMKKDNGKITITTNSHNRPINNSISPKERLLSKTGDVVSEKGRDLRNIRLILVKGIIFQRSIATQDERIPNIICAEVLLCS